MKDCIDVITLAHTQTLYKCVHSQWYKHKYVVVVYLYACTSILNCTVLHCNECCMLAVDVISITIQKLKYSDCTVQASYMYASGFADLSCVLMHLKAGKIKTAVLCYS